MLAAIARGLHLSLDERDHLFRLAGHPTPARELRLEHVDAGLMRVLDRLWSEHEIAVPRGHQKRIRTAELGVLEVYCQMLYDLDQDQALLIFTATPGSDSYDKLRLLSVIGTQKLRTPPGRLATSPHGPER